MASHTESVIFHSPSEMEASVLITASWKRPLTEVLIESGAAGGFGNMVSDACSGFLEWCFAQPHRPFDWYFLSNLPGLPFPGAQWDRWEWHDKLMKEVGNWESPPVLVDLDEFQINHRGEIVWPPPERRRPQRRKPQVPPGERFAAGWFGTHIGGERLDSGTYTYFLPNEVPPIPIPLSGTFDWLRAASRRRPIGSASGINASLDRLQQSGIASLPDEFVAFFRSPTLWGKVRSCTDCYFNLDTTPVEIPGGLGWLVRFMSDSQDCKHWHLYLSPCGTKHAVAATYHFRGSGDSHLQGGKPHPRDITICARSFEEFIYRLWIENELFFASYAKEDLPPGGAEYLAFYQPRAH